MSFALLLEVTRDFLKRTVHSVKCDIHEERLILSLHTMACNHADGLICDEVSAITWFEDGLLVPVPIVNRKASGGIMRNGFIVIVTLEMRYRFAVLKDADEIRLLAAYQKPHMNGKVFFAGEHTDGDSGNVAGAFASGRRAARDVRASLGKFNSRAGNGGRPRRATRSSMLSSVDDGDGEAKGDPPVHGK